MDKSKKSRSPFFTSKKRAKHDEPKDGVVVAIDEEIKNRKNNSSMKLTLGGIMQFIIFLGFVGLVLLHNDLLPEEVYQYEFAKGLYAVTHFVGDYSYPLLIFTWLLLILGIAKSKIRIGSI